MSIRGAILLGMIICTPELQAQQGVLIAESAGMVFELGEVSIVGQAATPFDLELKVSQLYGSRGQGVPEALAGLQGVLLMQSGARNEAYVGVRGFDQRQVPVFVDGVPVYASYDGYTDLARFLVPGLSKITVSRAGSSALSGPNTLGGTINLVSSKPVSPFEIELSSGAVFNGNGYGGMNAGLQTGIRRERYYLQAVLAMEDGKPFTAAGHEVIPNSQHRDLNSSIKIGFTPNAADSYVIGFHLIDGSKGVPAYEGEDPQQPARYWQFPVILRQGAHFNSRTFLGMGTTLQTRIYYESSFSELQELHSTPKAIFRPTTMMPVPIRFFPSPATGTMI